MPTRRSTHPRHDRSDREEDALVAERESAGRKRLIFRAVAALEIDREIVIEATTTSPAVSRAAHRGPLSRGNEPAERQRVFRGDEALGAGVDGRCHLFRRLRFLLGEQRPPSENWVLS